MRAVTLAGCRLFGMLYFELGEKNSGSTYLARRLPNASELRLILQEVDLSVLESELSGSSLIPKPRLHGGHDNKCKGKKR